MSEVILLATVRPRPGREAEALARFTALLEPTHAEPGCLLYALHRVEGTPGDLVFVEKWASQGALDAHAGAAHLREIAEVAPELLRQPTELTVLRPVPGGDPALGLL
jgi:quinol monooxygenase YgiN